MKILISTDPEIPVPPELYGGAERAAYHLINGLISQGYQVVLVANKNSKKTSSYGLYKWPTDFSTGIFNIIRNAFFLLKVIKKEKPDIILSYSRILYLYPSFLLTRKKFIKRYGRPVSGNSTKLADFIMGKRIRYISVAEHLTKNVQHKNKWTVIHNFTDTSFFNDIPNEQRNYYLFLGRIEHIKGTYEAIQVALKMKVKLIIAGNVENENLQYFESKVKPYLKPNEIEYVGSVNDTQKRELLQGAKAFLFPINWEEPFANVIPEALACGTPVFAFNNGCVKESIVNGVNGYAVNTIEEMCTKLLLLDNINRSDVRRSAEDNFSTASSLRKHIELFKALTA